MDNSIKLKFSIEPTDPACPLSFEVFWDGVTQAHCFHVRETEHVEIYLDDTQEAEHTLEIVMSGKTQDHTKLDSDGNIVQDALLVISNVIIDDMDISQLLQQFSVYTHDNNGSSDPVQQPFYSKMGCNGTVTFRFSTPYYLWLLEHM
jgi:hypothetical protein